jgi:hypothetical protein
MRRRGWIRLWIVVSAIGVPAAAEWQFQHDSKFWSYINEMTVKTCVDAEFSEPSHPDALECGKKQGTFETVFERQHTTPARYWSLQLAGYFVIDCILTALLFGGFLVTRWVARGFRETD